MSLDVTAKHLKSLGIQPGRTSVLIADRALARGIEVFADPKGRLSMRVNGQVRWFSGAKSNLNATLAKRCVQQKDITSRLLRSRGVNAPENMVFSADRVSAAWEWGASMLPLVVKPPDGRLGELVHLDLQDFSEFSSAFEAVAKKSGSVLVEQWLPGVEHRVLVIYGKVVAAARRIPANVLGDGLTSVGDLIEGKNQARRDAQNPAHWELPVDELTLNQLAKQNLSLESIPAADQRVWLRANSNVHSGGDGVDATDELSEEEVAIAERAIRAIPGLKLAGLDMLLPRDGISAPPTVLEVNGHPMITGHHYPWFGQERDAAGALVEAMFPQAQLLISPGEEGNPPTAGVHKGQSAVRQISTSRLSRTIGKRLSRAVPRNAR